MTVPRPAWMSRRPAARPSLLVQFGSLSLVIVVVLGLVIGQLLHTLIADRAQANARASAEVYLQLVQRSFFTPDLQSPSAGTVATPDQLSLSEQLTGDPVVRQQVLSATAWLADGTVVFSTARDEIGTRELLPASARKALAGETVSGIADSSRVRSDAYDLGQHAGEKVMFVDMPLSIGGSSRPGVVVEITQDYVQTEAAIRHDTSMVYGWLAGGLLVLYLALFRVVATASRRIRHQSAVNRDLALHDTLTGLANRSLLRDVATQALTTSRRHDDHVALLLLDLDRFKEINDTLGHHHGDLLLALIGPRLRPALRPGDTIARLGGDEFVVLLPGVVDAAEALQIARSVLGLLDEVFAVEGVELDVGGSIGIAVSPEHGRDFETLLRHADVAMYAAKTNQTGATVYDPAHDANSPARLAMLGELRRGIDTGQLVLHYQPQVDMDSGEVTGAEALVRWAHPTRGLLFPDEFIPLAERTGLIRPLTLAVLDQALAQAARWAQDGRPLAVAVNLSARSLLELTLRDDVAAALARHGVQGGMLELEITESTVMADPERALVVLRSLTELGVTVSIDDFGTGYSSMAYLQRLPVHGLKIDRSFVTDLGGDVNEVIVSSSIDLARSLGLHVIAEGVEDRSTWDRLARLGCHTGQGYYLSRPVPAEVFDEWFARHLDGELAAVPGV